jgi:hypothetical protein
MRGWLRVQDAFSQVMGNTEPSNMKLYGLKIYGYRDIESLVPSLDPTYDEIETAYDAREHGISTMEMRSRKSDAESRCGVGVDAILNCEFPTEWGLSERVFNERWALTRSKCLLRSRIGNGKRKYWTWSRRRNCEIIQSS